MKEDKNLLLESIEMFKELKSLSQGEQEKVTFFFPGKAFFNIRSSGRDTLFPPLRNAGIEEKRSKSGKFRFGL